MRLKWVQRIATMVIGVLGLEAFRSGFMKDEEVHKEPSSIDSIDWRSMGKPLHHQNPHPQERRQEYPKSFAFEIRANTSGSYVRTTLTEPSKGVKGDD